jgi:hypothetical protein
MVLLRRQLGLPLRRRRRRMMSRNLLLCLLLCLLRLLLHLLHLRLRLRLLLVVMWLLAAQCPLHLELQRPLLLLPERARLLFAAAEVDPVAPQTVPHHMPHWYLLVRHHLAVHQGPPLLRCGCCQLPQLLPAAAAHCCCCLVLHWRWPLLLSRCSG